jgi:hypothetical protein
MKAFITQFNKNGGFDPTLNSLFVAIEKVGSVSECNVVIIPITYMNDYVADRDLMNEVESSGKKIVIVDFVEYGWDRLETYHLFGINTKSDWSDKFQNKEYYILDDFISRNVSKLALYFKRELPKVDFSSPFTFKVLPAEYPGVSTLPDYNQLQSFEDFNNRPIDVMMVWGLSNPSRPLLHGEFVKQSALNGQHLVSNIDHITICQKRGDKRMVAMLHVPDFARDSIYKLLHLQSLAKISISLNGAGKVCFRHTESSYNSVMALQEHRLERSYPWIDGVNCIELPNRLNSVLIDESRAYNKIMAWLENPKDLYEMYVNGISNWQNYEVNRYSSEYILKNIKSNL